MGRTPDRFPGPLEEDEQIVFVTNPTPPTVAGAMSYDGSRHRVRDAKGTYNPRTIEQVLFAEVSVDTTTTSTTFVDLLSIPITTVGGDLLITMSAAASNASNNSNLSFRILIDGVAQRGSQTRNQTNNVASSQSIVLKRSVAAGAHTVTLQWLVSGNTGQIRPVTNPGNEHASLLVQELAA